MLSFSGAVTPFADELLDHAARHVDGNIARPCNNRFHQKLRKFHALMMSEKTTVRKNAARALDAYPDTFSAAIRRHILFGMDELERMRKLVGPEADKWTAAQLEQLRQDIDALAALLLDVYESRKRNQKVHACGLPEIDVPQPDR